MSFVHIHAPKPTEKWLVATTCSDCGKRTKMICFYTPWYGWDRTCIRCGRSWADDERLPLDFIRQSRQRSIDAAKRRWRRS